MFRQRVSELLASLKAVRFGSGYVRFVNCGILNLPLQEARRVFSKPEWGGDQEVFIFVPLLSEGADIVVYSQTEVVRGQRVPLICQCKLYKNAMGPGY